ncbi:MAG: IS982 family transposase, partial [Actinomycetota bacterium]|nr:IS982 family transposase [Actinomycetota bacterium]
ALSEVHRTTFCRQAANLWKSKEHLWQELLSSTPQDPTLALCDSLPLPVCLFARAYRCRRFRGEAAFGKDTLLKQTFYGFRVHMRVCWPGVITRFSLAPANAHELSVLPSLVEHTRGIVVGDRNYWSPQTKEGLAEWDVELMAPYRNKGRDPHPKRSALLSRLRYRIDTVFSQLTQRYSIKRVWAKDLWHLANRLLRKVLSHTVALLLNHRAGNQPLQLSQLVA